MPPFVMSSPLPRIDVKPPHALRAALLVLALLAGTAVGMSDAPAWIALAIPVLLWIEWPKTHAAIAWSSDIARRGPLVVVSRRHVFLANARERRELALRAPRDV